jgi:glycosyltransferase involved in cell wall biosynthesis
MRLLLAIPYYAPAYAFGGSVTVAETIVAGVLASGHAVTVATTDVLDERGRVALDAPAQPEGAEVLRFPNVSHGLAARMNAYAPRGLRAWLAGNIHRFDIVLLLDIYSAVSVMAARAAERAAVPFVLQPLGTLSPARERGRPLVKRAFLTFWGRHTVRTATALMHVGEHEAEDFLLAGGRPERLVHMPLPLDLPAANDGPKAAEPTIAFVGRLHPIKRVDRLIEAVAIARTDVPGIRLEIVGPGERYRQYLEALAQRLGVADVVIFHGFVEVEEKLRVLHRAHVSALLSRSEGLPIAALEAMACGTPVVLSHGCHLDEVNGRAGLVVSESSAEAATALTRLLSDERLAERLAGGAARFAQEFRRETVMPEMTRTLHSISHARS